MFYAENRKLSAVLELNYFFIKARSKYSGCGDFILEVKKVEIKVKHLDNLYAKPNSANIRRSILLKITHRICGSTPVYPALSNNTNKKN